MKRNDQEGKVFKKLGECLYRFSLNGKLFGNYYARFKSDDKQIKRSLETDDRALAKRKLTEFRDEQRQVDRRQGKLTLTELCDRWLKSQQHRAPKTVRVKTAVVARINRYCPAAALMHVGKIRPSGADLCTGKV